MPKLEVTQDQLDRLDAVRDRLAADVVGKYGTVRRRDALEYLLDGYEGGDLGPDDDTAADGTAADEAAGGEAADGDAGEGATAGTTVSAGPTPTAGTGNGGGDAGGRLNAMMSLLEDHEDVWGEAGGGEERYEVELPDGSVERARTKDDVRALLFKHYR
jgi:hypothetical protein